MISDMNEVILLIATIVLGSITTFVSFRARDYGYEDHKRFLKFQAYGILIMYFGFSTHTLGDVLSVYYGESLELLLESIAHVIILISFVFFYKATLEVIKNTKEYWFK